MPYDSHLRQENLLVKSKARILATGDFLAPEGLTSRFSSLQKHSRATLKQWEQEHRIFSIEHDGQVYYPSYAFSSDGEVLPLLKEVIMVLHTKKDGWGLAFWFGSSNSYLGGAIPSIEFNSNPYSVLSAAVNETEGAQHG
ncbi:TPA: hypothetical protein QEM49_004305 [Pseudomonas putida]|uniref:hypothetical protein n=1 Tax=Pseudomonas putida TaxID=303 RepID=UPI0023644B51|nr:hypothetical protein [Pseudomonas putida]MDD2012499.1 hypothetical protein [Pseudomonas putida]HDS1779745.1 hypothetical protein [Pseudomonas putida]